MKKLLNISFAFLALVGICSSCTNDDIKIGKATIVKVNPSSVISTFTFEEIPGELAGFDSDYRLRITVLAYNEDGDLEAQDVTYCKNYNEIGTIQLHLLPENTYTVYAITDVMSDETQFWKIEGKESLSTTKIVDQEYMGGQYKILGIASQKISVNEGAVNEITLNPQAAGALCVVEFNSIHKYSNVENYTLETTKSPNYLQFTDNNADGYNTTEESNNGEFSWRLSFVEPKEWESSTQNIYWYQFVFPMKNVGFRFTKTTSDNKYYLCSDPGYLTLVKGGEYGFVLDLNSNTYSYGIKLNGKNYAKAASGKQMPQAQAGTNKAMPREQMKAAEKMFEQISPKSIAITDLATPASK